MDIQKITEQVQGQSVALREVATQVEKVVVGQKNLIDRLMIGLLCDAHILLEGLPGLAKTTAVKSLAASIAADFVRIQFTPDLLPADILGTQVFRPDKGDFEIRKGPVFHNIILADEINRAPAKVQSALLEAMAERQVTIGGTTFTLGNPFMVLATQNPIEQEGTYPLPEAQVDRFMLKVKVDYPTAEQEKQIVARYHERAGEHLCAAVPIERVHAARETLPLIHMEERITDYILNIVRATRKPEDFGLPFAHHVRYGASPRASIFLSLGARANAFLDGRAYVMPQDVKALAPDVLRHRIIVSYEAEAEGVTSDHLITELLERVEVP